MAEDHSQTTIFAGIFLMIQGIIYGMGAIYCCGIYTCIYSYPFTTQPDESEVSTLLYVAYLKGQCADTTGGEDTVSPAARRTFYLMITGAVFNFIMIPTSFLLLVSVICCNETKVEPRLYYPWVTCALMILIFDVTAGIMYGIDITKTQTLGSFASFIFPATSDLSAAEGFTDIPSIIMLIIFCRGFAFWLLNFSFFSIVIRRLVLILKKRRQGKQTKPAKKPDAKSKSAKSKPLPEKDEKKDSKRRNKINMTSKAEPPVKPAPQNSVLPPTPSRSPPAQISGESKPSIAPQPAVPIQKPAGAPPAAPSVPPPPKHGSQGAPPATPTPKPISSTAPANAAPTPKPAASTAPPSTAPKPSAPPSTQPNRDPKT